MLHPLSFDIKKQELEIEAAQVLPFFLLPLLSLFLSRSIHFQPYLYIPMI